MRTDNKRVRDGSLDDESSARDTDCEWAECSECSKATLLPVAGSGSRRPRCVFCCFSRPLLFAETVKAALLNGHACEGLRNAERCGICPLCIGATAAGPAAATHSRQQTLTSSSSIMISRLQRREPRTVVSPVMTASVASSEVEAARRLIMSRPFGGLILESEGTRTSNVASSDYNNGYNEAAYQNHDSACGHRHCGTILPSQSIAGGISSSNSLSRAMQETLFMPRISLSSDPAGMAAAPTDSSQDARREYDLRPAADTPDYSSSLLLAPYCHASRAKSAAGLRLLRPRRNLSSLSDPQWAGRTTAGPSPPPPATRHDDVTISPQARGRRDCDLLPQVSLLQTPDYRSALLLAPYDSLDCGGGVASGSRRPPAEVSYSPIDEVGPLAAAPAASIRRMESGVQSSSTEYSQSQATTDRVNRFLARRQSRTSPSRDTTLARRFYQDP